MAGSSEIILKTKNLTRLFGNLRACDDVSIEIPKGQIRAIIGPNGAGKTTLINLITNQISPTAGKVYYKDVDITNMETHKIVKLGLSKCFQITHIFSELTVFENIRMSCIVKHRHTFKMLPVKNDYLRDEVKEILGYIGMVDKIDRCAKELSYGDKRRLEVAITLALKPELMILDEPTAGVSKAEGYELMKMIREIARVFNMTLLFIEHNMDIVWDFSDQITVMNLGKVIATGSPEEIRQNSFVQRAYLGGEV